MTITEQHPLGSGFTASTTAAEVLDGIDLTGRTALVTGGSSGLGLETATALANAGARVIMPVRQAAMARSILAGATVIDGFDLGDLSRVARVAEEVAILVDGIDILVAAAGVMATPQRLVGPGWDYQLAINHLGHFAFIARLYSLLAVRQARVVVYSSAGHHASGIRWDDMHFLSGYDKWAAYAQSKTANVLFAARLDTLGQRDGVRAFSLHPGKIITGLQRDLAIDEQIGLGWIDQAGNVVGDHFKTPSQGAATGLWAATSSALDGKGGLYLEDCDIARTAEPEGSIDDGGVQPYALDSDEAERLWKFSARITATTIFQ
jgi:NAD(P)-dependent dehydrogenase (short-subunit alcohol dehydrogenase family)